MRSDGVAKQIARWTALGAFFLIPLAPLIVADPYFFPFITGKAFFFRILTEVAVVAWAVLALLDKEYRPRFSWIGIAFVAFVVWMFIADIFANNVMKAFWSNFERMEGWVLLAHLLGFFFAASAVLRVEKKWRAWFLMSLTVSVVVSAYALLQLSGTLAIHQGSTRIDASFGNSAYLAIYFLFNVFIALWLALTEQQLWLKWSLIALAVLEAVLIFFTETRGTVLGLVGALFLGALLTAFTAGKRARRFAGGMLVLLLLVAGVFYAARNSAFVQENHTLQRIASISLSDGQTRFTIWGMALRGVGERPLTGWGQEGFNYIFNKHYQPSLYGQESWFDRAHDAFIDWLTAGGVPAFVLYLSLFGSAIVLLWRNSELSRPERIALTAALAGYAFHNIFVFDNLYSYIYFFAILALIDSQVARRTVLDNQRELTSEEGATYALPVAAVVLIALIWSVNIPGMKAATQLIVAMTPAAEGPAQNISMFADLLTHPAFATQEIREQLVAFASMVAQNPSVPTTEKQQAVSLAVSEMQKQVAAYPDDARERLQLAYAYRAGGDFQNALDEIKAASLLSPNKEDIWIEIGATEWDVGNAKGAQAAFSKAYALGPQFPRLAVYAAAWNIAAGDVPAANDILKRAYGTTTIDSDVLAVAYYRTKDWPSLIRLWKVRASASGVGAQTWFSLAAAYYAAGDKQNAIATIKKAVALYPEAASSGAAAIQQIQGKTTVQ